MTACSSLLLLGKHHTSNIFPCGEGTLEAQDLSQKNGLPFYIIEVALSNCKHREGIVLISTTQGKSMLSKHLSETGQTSNGI